VVAISENSVMDEIQNRREYDETQTQENLPTEPLHIKLFPNQLLNEILEINKILTYPPGFFSNRLSLRFCKMS